MFPALLAVLASGCFSTFTRIRPVDPEAPPPAAAWEGPLEADVGGVYDGRTGEVVLEVAGTFRAGPPPTVPGVREECRTVGSGSTLAGEILGGLGMVLGGSLGGVGLYQLSAGCSDPDCQAVGLGAGIGGLIVLAGTAALFAGSLAIDLTYEADEPFDCVAGESVPFELPPPAPERRAVTSFGAVAPAPVGGAATLVPAVEGRVTVAVDVYLGCPERCAVLDARRDLAALPEARPFVEDVSVEVPVVAIGEDGTPGDVLGTERFRVRTVKLRALVDALAAGAALESSAGAFVRLRVTVKDAAGRPAADARVRVATSAPEVAVAASEELPLLALHESAPELFRAALRRATAGHWRMQAGTAGATAVPEGEGEASTAADGTALFLLPAGATVRVSAELAGGEALPERSVELPADGDAVTELELGATPATGGEPVE
ncbi:MAG: hypothetical protein JXB32_02660 [Deltaproteobacteria bacterium]|nr:hypothetical protein [Deltaproteobacteria bacterium]